MQENWGASTTWCYLQYVKCTLWLFNIAMDNGPFEDFCPIKTSIYNGFSMAMLNNQMVCQLQFVVLDRIL